MKLVSFRVISKSSRQIGITVATLSLLAMGNTSQAGVIAIDSSLAVVASTGLDVFEVVDSASVSQPGTIGSLGLLHVNAVTTAVGGTSSTSGSAFASWTNTAAGQVRFEGLGWDNSAFSRHISSGSSLQGTQWTYTFLADVSGQFSLDWDVALQQPLVDSFGLQGFRFTLFGAGEGQTLMQEDTTGTLTRNILAGNVYTAQIEASAGIFGGVGDRISFMDGVFNWSMDSGHMTGVAEPAPAVLLALGMLGTCSQRRRRRR